MGRWIFGSKFPPQNPLGLHYSGKSLVSSTLVLMSQWHAHCKSSRAHGPARGSRITRRGRDPPTLPRHNLPPRIDATKRRNLSSRTTQSNDAPSCRKSHRGARTIEGAARRRTMESPSCAATAGDRCRKQIAVIFDGFVGARSIGAEFMRERLHSCGGFVALL
jgi:hypothetical protein